MTLRNAAETVRGGSGSNLQCAHNLRRAHAAALLSLSLSALSTLHALCASHSFHGNNNSNNNTWERSTNNIASVGQKQSSHVHTQTQRATQTLTQVHCKERRLAKNFCFAFAFALSEVK